MKALGSKNRMVCLLINKTDISPEKCYNQEHENRMGSKEGK